MLCIPKSVNTGIMLVLREGGGATQTCPNKHPKNTERTNKINAKSTEPKRGWVSECCADLTPNHP